MEFEHYTDVDGIRVFEYVYTPCQEEDEFAIEGVYGIREKRGYVQVYVKYLVKQLGEWRAVETKSWQPICDLAWKSEGCMHVNDKLLSWLRENQVSEAIASLVKKAGIVY